MPAFLKVSNFKNSLHNIKINNIWRNVPKIYVNNNGNWKPLYSYNWNIGAWSGCSVSCGGGTQTRVVNCRRNDGLVVNDSICTTFVGSKPSTSQSCNTQSCGPTYYYNDNNTYWATGHDFGNADEIYSYSINITINGVKKYHWYDADTESNIEPIWEYYNSTSITTNGITYYRGALRKTAFKIKYYEVGY